MMLDTWTQSICTVVAAGNWYLYYYIHISTAVTKHAMIAINNVSASYLYYSAGMLVHVYFYRCLPNHVYYLYNVDIISHLTSTPRVIVIIPL